MPDTPDRPHACCPCCTDTPPLRRSRVVGATARPVECARCGTRFIPLAAGSQVLRPPRRPGVAAA